MLRSSNRELLRYLRNQLKVYSKSSQTNPKSYRRRKIAAAVSLIGSSAAIAAFAQSHQIIDGKDPKPLGPIYKFEEEADQLPLEYDVAKIEAFWSKRPTEVIKRTGEILAKIVPYFTKLVIWEYLIRKKIRDHPGLQKKYAIQLRLLLTELGPCFIKFGQAMSIRPDLLPSSFLFELQKLCDSVPSFPTQEAISVIEAELGSGAVQELFEDLSPLTQPIAAASLGQVYKLKLKPNINKGKVLFFKKKTSTILFFNFYLQKRKIMKIYGAVVKSIVNWKTVNLWLLKCKGQI